MTALALTLLAVLSPAQVYRQAAEASVTLYDIGDSGQGSGFVVASASKKTIVVTCAHVVEDEPAMLAKFSDGSADLCRVTRVDKKVDLATLECGGPVLRAALTVATRDPALYDPLFSAGSPWGHRGTASALIYDGPYKEGRSWLSGRLAPGASGSAVLDVAGEVQCVVQSAMEDGMDGGCVSRATLAAFLKK